MDSLINILKNKLFIDRFLEKPSSTDITNLRASVVGVGGAGGNAIKRLSQDDMKGLRLLSFNTDIQALGNLNNIPTFALGPKTTNGLGSGGNPKIGKQASEESKDQINELLTETDILFITAGMGGGTGTGASPYIADLAKKLGILTVAIVTTPFDFEGEKRKNIATLGIKNLKSKVDTLIVIDNNCLLQNQVEFFSLNDAFQQADKILKDGVTGIWNIISKSGLVNIDFADVKSVVSNGGMGYFAIGLGQGEKGVQDAVNYALSTPFFAEPLKGCTGVLMNVKGDERLSLDQVNSAAGLLRLAGGPNTDVIFGIVNDSKMKDKIEVTLLATGIESELPPNSYISPKSDVKKVPVLTVHANNQNSDLNLLKNGSASLV